MTTPTTPPTAPNAIDLQGLDQLRRRAARDDPAALGEVAVQFDAMFIGMMLDSARSANLGGGLLDGPETKQYLELMDRQVALDMARHGGLGFGKLLLQQLAPRTTSTANTNTNTQAPLAPSSGTLPAPPVGAVPGTADALAAPTAVATPAKSVETPSANPVAPEDPTSDIGSASSATAFVAQLLPHANQAAAALGVEPRLLLAQAALETGWGRAVPQLPTGTSTNNMFGVKAGVAWKGAHATAWTLENDSGGVEPKREDFRAYGSKAASLADYVALIQGTPRYAQATASAKDPEAYARAVQAAGYATDPAYADKWLAVYHGARLDGALRGLDGTASVSATPVAADGVTAPDGEAL